MMRGECETYIALAEVARTWPTNPGMFSTAREQFEGRYDVLREAELPPDIVRVFAAGAARTSEPEAPTFDREAGESEWLDRVSSAPFQKGSISQHRKAPVLMITLVSP